MDDPEPSSSAVSQPAAAARRQKQAVVVIHGIGEQRPMATIRSLVEALWTRDPDLTPPHRGKAPADGSGAARVNQSWITPDRRTASHELRRITTPYDRKGRRTDFYELYWADLTQGTTRARLFAWIRELLLRSRSEIPPDARKLYVATWIFAVVVALAAALLAFSFWGAWLLPVTAVLLTIAASFVLWVLDQFALPYFGDVAAYVQATPDTVESRAKVRERGLGLLRALADDDEYDRIVVVGHSLGSIIAYDLLQILWAERRPRGLEWPRDREVVRAIHAVGAFAALPREGAVPLDQAQLEAFRRAQWQLFSRLKVKSAVNEKPWKFSDFVTLGSPLSHAEFLIARNADAFRKGAEERLYSLSPPISDSRSRRTLLYYERPRIRAVHHAACFAATRWTNIFDIGNGWSTGDPFSGPMRENFGGGVEEHRVRLEWTLFGMRTRLFTHTHYWSTEAAGSKVEGEAAATDHLKALREAVDLARRADDAIRP
ncbi:hypothetical protein ABGN05_27545 [Aquibium sp. LZ166]|uniref:Alpha/beta hydrolase n=1 Tax=Aquibium pacificus TaxID=3153579 RepID=A0ABV3SRV4_9HYPH